MGASDAVPEFSRSIRHCMQHLANLRGGRCFLGFIDRTGFDSIHGGKLRIIVGPVKLLIISRIIISSLTALPILCGTGRLKLYPVSVDGNFSRSHAAVGVTCNRGQRGVPPKTYLIGIEM